MHSESLLVTMILVIFLLTKMLDKDLISVETGRYVNVQSMIFKFVYERSPYVMDLSLEGFSSTQEYPLQ